MSLFKVIFYGALAFLSAVGIFIGAVTMLTSLQNGSIMLTYTADGKAVAETISRAADAGRFWKIFAAMGMLPAVLGVVAMWYSVRKLRAQ